MIPIEIAKYFQSTFIIIIMIVSIAKYSKLSAYPGRVAIQNINTDWFQLYFFCFILCLLIGFRPFDREYFGDTWVYAATYKNTELLLKFIADPSAGDRLFNWLMLTSSNLFSVNVFFFFIALGYIYFALNGFKRFFNKRTSVAILFFLGSLSFWGYGINGIRNGLAASITIYCFSLALVNPNTVRIIIAIILGILGMQIHKSITLPIVCFIASFFIKDTKLLVYWWFFSIFLYLTMHGFFENFFANLGFDDRLSRYIDSVDKYESQGLTVGFRPDFLLYSFMPIWLGLHALKHCPNSNNVYPILLKTYILANSFWILLMGASYSNRFAYLSWFLMPIVLAYPCLNMNIWGKNQDKNAGLILLAHSGFTFFMYFVYYA